VCLFEYGCYDDNISGSDQDAVFAAADEFSHLIDDDVGSLVSPGDMIGTGAVSRRDSAGNSRLSKLVDISQVCHYSLLTHLHLSPTRVSTEACTDPITLQEAKLSLG